MKAKVHDETRPRGIRDPLSCKVQAGGRLIFIRDGQPEFWCDRPRKFKGHIQMLLRKPGTVIEDIKWRQLGGKAWWRIPAWPDGRAEGGSD